MPNLDSPLLQNLNDMQKEAVLTNKGPVLVLAGAGSGKTSALTSRIAYLIQEEGVSPWNILAVTFTNKAANEMKERVLRLLNRPQTKFNPGYATPDTGIPNVGTFHSICVRILRKHIHELGYDNSFVIYDTADQQILIKRVLDELYIDTKQFNPESHFKLHLRRQKSINHSKRIRQIRQQLFHRKSSHCIHPLSKRITKGQCPRLRRYHHENRRTFSSQTGHSGKISGSIYLYFRR
jgi:DNA helicase-2/ATP-dependent DNA helicase PcrA